MVPVKIQLLVVGVVVSYSSNPLELHFTHHFVAYYEKELEQMKGNMKRTQTKINETLGHKKEKDQIKTMNFS